VAIGGANLDVNGIVGQLMSLEQRPVAMLNKKEADYQAKISAYGNISSALSGFQTSVQELTKLEKFQSQKATSSDATAFSASASGKAATGSHSISISSLAQTQKLAVAGQESDVTSIGTGQATKLVFDFGTIAGGSFDEASGKYKDATFSPSGQGSKTLTIDSGNNTLQGIRDAINAAKMGVTASVINDGSAAPFKLTLSPTSIGASNSLKISVTGEDAISKLLSHDPGGTQNLSQTATAQNAVFTVDGVTINKTGNSVADVIPGVTLELLKTTTTPATLTVGNDSSAITNSVQGFVKGYNDLNKTLQDMSSYNAATKQGAVLQGDSTLRVLQSQIRAVLNTPISNSGGAYTNLTQIGITLQKDGTMALDTAKLNTAITKNPNDVASLFATVGTSSDPLLSYTSAANSTGTYPVNVTKLASKGSMGGCEEVETLIIDAGENDALDVTVNGVSASVVLTPGTYTEDSLATEIQSKINGASTLSSAGISVSVVHDQFGYLVTSNTVGSKSSVEITGTGALNLFGKSPVYTTGTDVEGTINGSPASGSGQTLTAISGAALGLKVDVSGGAVGERGKVNYSQGYAHILNQLITSVLAQEGQLESRKRGINSSIKEIESRRQTLEQRLPLQEARFRKQYSSLETSLSNMSKTSSYLNQQLSNLPRPY
jgi:flagellar hook-associated protein 2